MIVESIYLKFLTDGGREDICSSLLANGVSERERERLMVYFPKASPSDLCIFLILCSIFRNAFGRCLFCCLFMMFILCCYLFAKKSSKRKIVLQFFLKKKKKPEHKLYTTSAQIVFGLYLPPSVHNIHYFIYLFILIRSTH